MNDIGIEIDTNRLVNDSEKMNNLITELELKINNYFKKIYNIPVERQWIGNNADNYVNIAIQDKEDFLKHLEGLKKISSQMRSFAEELEERVNKNQNSVD